MTINFISSEPLKILSKSISEPITKGNKEYFYRRLNVKPCKTSSDSHIQLNCTEDVYNALDAGRVVNLVLEVNSVWSDANNRYFTLLTVVGFEG